MIPTAPQAHELVGLPGAQTAGEAVVMLVVLVAAALLIVVGVGAYMLYLTPNPKDSL
jgi:hypothetical protein